ncbi:hypothetical protein IV203_022095 [Nitzschia inconspicua]|uniref:Uncharacterized protein n=1 Tax=Nitzschia inconspicua TaxID=303405 RepID=A0A9K3KHW5_9STRA|nr:hypothetical protein IV203_022095 [Nitzschia inconspicua]
MRVAGRGTSGGAKDCVGKNDNVDANKIGDPTKHNLCNCLKDGKGYMFPAKFHGLAAKEKLVIELKLAALKAEFCLVISSSKGLKSLPATTRREGAEDWTGVFDSMMADEFERDYRSGEVLNIEGMDFLTQQPESWLLMEDDNNTLVRQCKQLHELTWVQKKVAVKGVPLPEIRRTVVAELHGRNMDQEPIFEVGTNED